MCAPPPLCDRRPALFMALTRARPEVMMKLVVSPTGSFGNSRTSDVKFAEKIILYISYELKLDRHNPWRLGLVMQ